MSVSIVVIIALVCLVVGLLVGVGVSKDCTQCACATVTHGYRDWQFDLYHRWNDTNAYEKGRAMGREEATREAYYTVEMRRYRERCQDRICCPPSLPVAVQVPDVSALTAKYVKGKRDGWKAGQANMRNRIQANMLVMPGAIERGYPIEETFPGEIKS